MNIVNLEKPILQAAYALLSPHVPQLTPTKLVDALRQFEKGEPDRMHTQAYASEQLGVSKVTIYRMIMRGDLHGIKVGKVWRIPQSEIDRIKSQPVESVAI